MTGFAVEIIIKCLKINVTGVKVRGYHPDCLHRHETVCHHNVFQTFFLCDPGCIKGIFKKYGGFRIGVGHTPAFLFKCIIDNVPRQQVYRIEFGILFNKDLIGL